MANFCETSRRICKWHPTRPWYSSTLAIKKMKLYWCYWGDGVGVGGGGGITLVPFTADSWNTWWQITGKYQNINFFKKWNITILQLYDIFCFDDNYCSVSITWSVDICELPWCLDLLPSSSRKIGKYWSNDMKSNLLVPLHCSSLQEQRFWGGGGGEEK